MMQEDRPGLAPACPPGPGSLHMASKQAAGRGPGEKRKRVVLTLREKIDICTRLERGENRKALMQEYNVGMSTLYDIKAHKAQLLRFFANSDSNKALEHRRTLHTPKLEHLDRVLYEWFLVKRAEGVPVSGPMLIQKAKDFYEQMQLTEPCVFSGGWLWRFKARHGIKLDTSCEKQVADHQAAEQFCGFFRSLMAEHSLAPEQVYNADQTGLFWRCLPNPSEEGGPLPGLKQSKDRLTVLMCANATGSHKIKPLVIGRGGGPRAFKVIQDLPVAYRAQGSAWVDKEIFLDWFHHIFVPSVKEHFLALGLAENSKGILLLDSSRARPQEAELVAGNIFTIFLPASVASLIQPMDQGIRRDFMRNFNPPIPLQGFHPRYSVHDAVFSVACAWDAVPSHVFSRAWRKLWPEAALVEGSSSEEEAEHIGTKPHSQTLAHIIELVQEAPSCLGGRPHQTAVEEPAGPGRGGGEGCHAAAELARAVGTPDLTKRDGARGQGEGVEADWAQAAESFDTVVAFAERQPCFTAQELGQLRALHSMFTRQRQLAQQRGAFRTMVKREGPHECSPLPCSSTDDN
ncbi:jerky protein homolog [Erinaceus europaeus]|uniref:Jerky protein homolog n=1 Tax=Erinaceus europaeus TaxID=9365 RepID=A0A1S3AIC5_ERIEU|nr:jerky protein homolog [Erinaceus europaeus]XP_060051881.1 jerky protein homolog [Erinaceus europaeus]